MTLITQSQAALDLNQAELAMSLLNEAVQRLTVRQQDLLIANKYDWPTVEEFRQLPIAKDLSESKEIRAAARRAKQNRSEKKKKPYDRPQGYLPTLE